MSLTKFDMKGFVKALRSDEVQMPAPLKDTVILKVLDRTFAPAIAELHAAVQARVGVHKFLAANGPRVALIESGMDCDGTQYDGHVHFIDANIKAYDKCIEDTIRAADGPCFFQLATVETGEKTKYRSRDRALEAFEDGHPWSLTYGSLEQA